MAHFYIVQHSVRKMMREAKVNSTGIIENKLPQWCAFVITLLVRNKQELENVFIRLEKAARSMELLTKECKIKYKT